MVLAYLVSGRDPLDAPREVVVQWGRGHPALTYLSEGVGFDWPTTTVHSGGGTELQGDWLKVGHLKYLGYAVGSASLSADERHEILDRAYHARRLPPVFSDDYRDDWGGPRSSARLQKMAQSIASFCRSGKRRGRSMDIAVAEWDSDLEWLRVKYYTGRHRFEWPSTDVR